ncbi:MAG: hypothetical protein GC164_09635 [Phycisphaera sp.]|nr:hypothetical protein [Phycisphaera sp.]
MPTSTSVRLLCPNLKCRTILSVPSNARGKVVRCRLCGTRITIPIEKNEPKPVAEAPTPEQGEAKTEV